MQIRQGDVMLATVQSVPDGFKKEREVSSEIVARGEVTGHYHEIVCDDSENSISVYVNNAGVLCYHLAQPAVIRHQEHGEIQLPTGTYIYEPQREYTPEEIRNVQD